MATVTPPRREFNRADADRRVRHPLHALRGYIRRYVTLEGTAVAVLFLALWFWIGVGLDYGLFALLRFDWVKEIDRTAGETSSFWLRAFILFGLVAGLLAVVAFKVLRRLFREFSDRALALVLERRFPRQLGDRLITAVEMADPRLADKYGFSQIMLDQTIRDAADRVEKLPVHEVFNWGRLRWRLVIAALVTVGAYLFVGTTTCIVNAATGRSASPVDFFWEFNHVAGTWFERNILLQNHRYWLGNEYLELVRFPEIQKGDDPPGMRVARDEQRPDVWVRAVKWVYADRGPDAPEGWRPLRWSDLPQLLATEQLNVDLPADWAGWVIDMHDLDPAIPAGVIPEEWGWHNKTAGHIRKELDSPRVKLALADERAVQVGARAAVERLLDWRTWTIDKIDLQISRTDVANALIASGHEPAYRALVKVRTQLAEVVDSPRMRGTVRQLAIPKHLIVHRRGKTTKSSSPLTKQENNKYSFSLNDLKESVSFYVSGDEYSTPSKHITLVPPPSVFRLSVDKQEPAYIHYRLLGDDAGKVKGGRQIFRDVPVSTTGNKTVIAVPLGTTLTVTGVADRELKPGLRLAEPLKRDDAGSVTPAAAVSLHHDKKTFSVSFRNVQRMIEFEFEFRDLDNVKGHRHIVIKPTDDKAPTLVGVVLNAPLRLEYDPLIDKGPPPKSTERLLITPNARLPFKGTIGDDYGLSRIDWEYKVVEVELQKLGEPSEPGKEPPVVLEGDPRARRAGLVLSTLQYMPGSQGYGWFAPAYVGGLSHLATEEAKRPGLGPQKEGRIEMELAEQLLTTRGPNDVTFEQFQRLLRIQPSNRPLAVELIELKGDKEEKDFVARYRTPEFDKLSVLVADLLDFFGVAHAEREALQGQARTDPLGVLRRLRDLAGKTQEEREPVLALLRKQPERALLREHFLEREGGFDVKQYLPKLKALPGEVQRHYELRVFVKATDNNVERLAGPTAAPPKGPFTFLVISEKELIDRIVKQEDNLYNELKAKVDALEQSKNTLEDEVKKLASPQAPLKFVAARADQTRVALRETGDIARNVLEKYNAISIELLVNRVVGDKRKMIEERIVNPLAVLCEKSNGDFSEIERLTTSFLRGMDDDLLRLKKADASKKVTQDLLDELADRQKGHLANGTNAGKLIDNLIVDLRKILEAMQGAVGITNLEGELEYIATTQDREILRQLQAHRLKIQRELWELLQGKGK